MKHKLSRKIIAALGLVIFTIICVYAMIFNMHYGKYEERIVGEENIKTLRSLETSIETIIKNSDDYSKMLVADSVIQKQMETGDLLSNVSGQSEVIKKIYSIFQFSDYVESIWLIDEKGQMLIVGGGANYSLEDDHVEYEELKKPYGAYEIEITYSKENGCISLVRSYNSLDDFMSLGVIGVDLKYQSLQKMLANVIDEEQEQIAILNDDNEIIMKCGTLTDDLDIITHAKRLSGNQREILQKITIRNKEYMLAGVHNGNHGWKIIRYSQAVKNENVSEIVKFNGALIFVIGILILCSAAFISSMLTRPIQTLMHAMKETEGGNFKRIVEKPMLDEFQVLFKGYNRMVEQIERLIQGTIDKQRRIRQVEMNEVQEQMKPHFLYNTLDSIQALAMMGESKKVCDLVEALGGFYRKSVSGGREMLTIEEEFQMAKDYADIMRIRFEDSFTFDILLDEACKHYMIPKLTIQPLVENSFQHGVRVKEQFGKIALSAIIEDEKLHIMIRDNGDGVPEDVIFELMENKEPKRGKSLGLRGTIERLRLMYEDGFNYEIKNASYAEIHLYIATDKLKEQTDER